MTKGKPLLPISANYDKINNITKSFWIVTEENWACGGKCYGCWDL